MTIINQTGYATLYLFGPDNKTLTVRLSNIKSDADDADVYDVVQAVSDLLAYPLQSSMRIKRAEITD